MILVKAFVGALVGFLVVDVVWITGVAGPMYDQQVGDLLRVQGWGSLVVHRFQSLNQWLQLAHSTGKRLAFQKISQS